VVQRGAPAPVLVSGYSGAGETSLVTALHGPVLAERGFFVSGKLDAIRRGVPYAGMAQALGDLFLQILAGDVETTSAWAAEIRAALGSVGTVLTDVVPELELLIGPQPPVSPLGPAEAQNRFAMAFHALMSVVARPQPIVLFLDDMQWADPGTLRLIQGILQAGDLGPLLLVLAYRENEVDAAHPFLLAVEEVRRSGIVVDDVAVLPLTEPVV
jgi:histidine kinase